MESCQLDCDNFQIALLQPTQYQLIFDKLGCATFYCHSLILPELSLGFAEYATPFHDVHIPGEKLRFSDLQAEILVDKSLDNYRTLYNWMRKLSMRDSISTEDVSQCRILVADKTEFVFNGVFPLNISSVRLQSNAVDTDPITFTATFNIVDFDLT